MTTTAARKRAVYPSFYRVVHRAWNGYFDGTIFACDGAASYEPDQHRCFEFAGALRVELHAEGIMLSNDGIWRATDGRHALADLRTLDDVGIGFITVRSEDIEAFRARLADAEAALYDGPDDSDDAPVKPVATWRRWISRALGVQVF